MALNTQEEQRKVYISSFLWLLSLVFTLLCFPSIFGFLRLKDGDFKSPHDPNRVSCRKYFVHSFNSAVMGYVDLIIKIAEIIVYILYKISVAIMCVFPWRKDVLEKMINEVTVLEAQDDKDRKFLKAGIVIG